jgi:hypothetical protein
VIKVQTSIFFVLGSLLFSCVIAPPSGAMPPGPRIVHWDATLKEGGQLPLAPQRPGPDDRFKADILVFVAHPDDETEVSAYLAKAIYDEHRRVAVIFGTRGDGGGNAMGYEQAASLGAEREIEARRACAYLGIANVWFLDGPDTPDQDVLHSLETWNHGAVLGKAVRLMRLTRPDVVVTWLPNYVAGENHAGDPTKFPEQISYPRDRLNIGNLSEGLRPWQPKKIYYFSDASHHEFLEGQGPEYSTTEVSPARQMPYYRIAAEEMAFHLTQGDTGQEAQIALAASQFQSFQQPVRLIFGKSLVGGTTTGDILESVSPGAIGFAPVRGFQIAAHEGLSLELGGPWHFYRDFWKAHNIEHLAQLLPKPEVSMQAGATLHIPLLIFNDSIEPAEVTLSAVLPPGWTEKNGSVRYPVGAHEVYPIEAAVSVSSAKGKGWQLITWKAEAKGKTVASIELRVNVTEDGGLPQ